MTKEASLCRKMSKRVTVNKEDIDNQKIISLISLAMKAGKIKSGEFAVLDAIVSEKSRLIIVAEDAAENTKKKYQDKASYRNIPLEIFSAKSQLGKAIGKDETAAVAIMDEGFAKALLEKWR